MSWECNLGVLQVGESTWTSENVTQVVLLNFSDLKMGGPWLSELPPPCVGWETARGTPTPGCLAVCPAIYRQSGQENGREASNWPLNSQLSTRWRKAFHSIPVLNLLLVSARFVTVLCLLSSGTMSSHWCSIHAFQEGPNHLLYQVSLRLDNSI